MPPHSPSRPRGRVRRLCAGFAVTSATLLAVLLPTAAQAHSLESSTISTHVTADGVDVTISIAVATLDDALGTDYATGNADASLDEITDYVADHLTVTSDDGTVWAESFSGATLESVDGIDSYIVDVSLDTGTSSTDSFEIDYDAVIEAIPSHEAVVVLTDVDGDVSTAGVITSSSDSLTMSGAGAADSGASAVETGVLDMIGYGFHHVLEGADHLLFLAALLLTAPLVVVAGRWRRRTELVPTLRDVVGVVTAFTVGHSLTLIASALGWVSLPTQLVEVIVAASVGVAAIHAIRPLVRGGEKVIAGAFGLVHGLAFAGILTDLGLQGSTTVVTLLAFNVGVELAQLAATAALFPSLYLLACTHAYLVFRTAGAGLALVAATGWVLERLGVLGNPLGAVEDAAIGHPWMVVSGLALLAAATWACDRMALGRLERTRERTTDTAGTQVRHSEPPVWAGILDR